MAAWEAMAATRALPAAAVEAPAQASPEQVKVVAMQGQVKSVAAAAVAVAVRAAARQLLRSGSLERQHAVDNLTRPAPAADVDAVEGPFEFGDADTSVHV